MTTNLAKKIDPTEVYQETATVVRLEGETVVVRAGTGEVRARRATSCLLSPEPADVVLLARTWGGKSWVLAVLEREGDAPRTLGCDGDLAIKLPAGKLSLVAQEGVELVSAGDVAVVSEGVRVNAVHGSVVVQTLGFLGSVLSAEVERVKLLAGTLDSVLTRFSQRVKRSYRVVEERDQVRADQIDHSAGTSISMHAPTAVITAEELVKMDGEQIHLG